MYRLVFDKITFFWSLPKENYMDFQACPIQGSVAKILRQNLNLEKVLEPFLIEVDSPQYVFHWDLFLEVP